MGITQLKEIKEFSILVIRQQGKPEYDISVSHRKKSSTHALPNVKHASHLH